MIGMCVGKNMVYTGLSAVQVSGALQESWKVSPTDKEGLLFYICVCVLIIIYILPEIGQSLGLAGSWV